MKEKVVFSLVRVFGCLWGFGAFVQSAVYLSSPRYRTLTTSFDPELVRNLSFDQIIQQLGFLGYGAVLMLNFVMFRRNPPLGKQLFYPILLLLFTGLSIALWREVHLTIDSSYKYWIMKTKSWEIIPATFSTLLIIAANWYLILKELLSVTAKCHQKQDERRSEHL